MQKAKLASPKRSFIPFVRFFPPASSLYKLPAKKLRLVDRYTIGQDIYPVDIVAEIYIDESGRYIYHIREPEITESDKALYEEVMNILYFEPPRVEGEKKEFTELLLENIRRLVNTFHPLYPNANPNVVYYYVMRDAVGALWIDPMLRDPFIEDISCNGANIPIYVWHQRYEYIRTTLSLDEDKLDLLVLKLAHMAGKHISIARPVVDAILPGGHRLAATYRKEVTTKGSSFTIRKFREKPITITELISRKTIDPIIAAYSWLMMEFKRNGLVIGVTGSGKTTLLNAIATLINPSYKVVTIEDTPELRLPLENWVQLVSREFAGEGEEGGASITLFDLVKVSLRYRPEIIIVGEVRGEEAYVLFQAMATGHGGLSTLHAESIYSAVERLTSPPMNIPKSYMPLINFSFLIRRVEIEGRIQRRVAFGWEVRKYGDYVEVFRWNPREDRFIHKLKDSITLKNIAENFMGITVDELISEHLAKRAAVFYFMVSRGMYDFDEIASMFAQYYAKKESFLNEILSYVKSMQPDETLEEIYSLMKK